MTSPAVTITSPNGTRVQVIRTSWSAKVGCAVCGARGYEWGPWLNRHGEHDHCPCGAQVAKGYLGQHQGSKARHGNPCPGWVKGGAR